jgi:hypothetical protein
VQHIVCVDRADEDRHAGDVKPGLFTVVFALSGCELIADIPTPSGSSDVDASMIDGASADVMIDADGCSGSFVRLCTQPSGTDVELPAAIDTSASALCAIEMDATAGELCVIAARSINLAAGVTLAVTGTRPLVLVASTTITIDGTMNVRNPSGIGCTRTDPTEISGGAGGSRGGRGGKGGNGGDDGVGGVAGDAMPPSLLGGCPGGAGQGDSDPPGVGGGSVLLIAQTIMVTGTINATGTGGGGANVSLAGGAGGGSGGVIVVDAPNVTIAGTLLASGGGGGEGGRGAILGGGSGGNPGAAPNPLTPSIAASGGSGLAGGDGGPGGAILAINGTDGGRSGTNVATGGGGGGAAGIIEITATAPTITGAVVPAAM